MKNQFGEAERVLNESLDQVNTRFQSAEKDAREKLTQLRDQIQLDGVKSRLETVNLAKQGARIGAETVELLGLAQVADLEKLSAKLDRFATKAETLRRRTTDITALKKAAKDAERAQAKMEKRVAKLEKSVWISPRSSRPRGQEGSRREEACDQEDPFEVAHCQEIAPLLTPLFPGPDEERHTAM